MPFQTQLRRLCLLLSLLLGLGASSTLAQVSGGATVSGSASLNAACTPTCVNGPLVPAGVAQPASNAFTAPLTAKPLFLFGSHTWNSAQDEDTGTGTTTLDFNAYVTFLKQHGQNATILWHKDLPKFCNWGAGGTWTIADSGTPWARSGTVGGSDGHNKWDLTTFNQPYFDRMRSRSLQLYTNGIYSIVELFDGLGLSVNRCGTTPPTGDGYPFTAANNINSIDDGYTSGAAGVASMTMSTTNAITAVQDAYVRKMIDTLNDVPNVVWEISEEAPCGSNFWQTHMISVIKTYEATKPFKHPVLFPTFDVNCPSDSTLLNSNADSVAPFGASVATYHVIPTVLCGTGAPACKTVMNDSDHTYFGMWTDTPQVNRNFLWENVARGSGVLFMDPYVINWTSGSRNLCASPVNGVCSGVDTRYNLFRDNFGYAAALIKKLINVAAMSASTTLCSTTYCLVNNSATTSEFVVYAPTGGAFTVNLSAQTGRTMNVQWLDPTLGTYTNSSSVIGGSATQSFTPPWGSSYDAVLYLSDGGGGGGGGSTLGWTKLPATTAIQGNGNNQCPPNNFGGSSYAFNSKCGGMFAAWTSFAFDANGANGPRMLSASNGGHSDYLGNEVYEMPVRTGTSLRLNAPSINFPATCASAEGSNPPASGHTYGFNLVADNTRQLLVGPRITGDVSGNGCSTTRLFALDLNTVSQACAPTCSQVWTELHPAGWITSETIIMMSGAYNHADGKVYTYESFNSTGNYSIGRLDLIANTFTKLSQGSTNATLYGSLGIDEANQAIVVFSTPNDAPNPGGVFWCDLVTNCASILHPALDASCSALGINGSALTYDTVRQELVGWPGSGGTVYIVSVTKGSPGNVTCAPETYGTVAGVSFPEKFNANNGNTTPMFNKFHYDAPDDLYMLCANIDTTCWKLKRPPVVRLTNTSGSPITNAPVSVSESFAQGDIAQFPQASINGSLITTQADVKQRWSDSSVRQAIVSFVVPTIGASGTQKVYFLNQVTGNNAGQLVKADMLSAPYNFDMQIQQTGATNNTVSARAMLTATPTVLDPGSDPGGGQNGICRYWLKGPIVTAIICDDRSAARSFDFKSDASAGTPLHPYFEVWFYPQGNYVSGMAGVENTWGSSTIANSMRDQTYSFVLTGGNTSPSTLFTQSSFNHIGRSRWVKDFSINGTAPPIAIDHNMAYEAYAKAIPNFDPTLIVPASMVTGNSWVTGDQSIPGTSSGPPDGSGGVGQYGKDMNTGGSSDWFGILNTWEAMYWFSHGATGMYNQVIGNSQVGGRIPFHYRESDSSVSGSMFYDASGTISPVGRTVSVNARPMMNWGIGSQVSQFNDTCSGANARTLNIGTVTDDGWINGGGSGGMDGSHWPEFAYTAALITGKFWYIEEAQMSGAYMVGFDRGCPSGHRNGSMGIIWSTQEGRGTAWMTRAALWAWAASPDGSPEQAYYFDKLQNNGVYHQGKYGVANTDATRVAAYNFGVTQQDDVANNPLHIYLDGWYGSFVEAPLDTSAGHLLTGTSPWEEQYTIVTFAQARDMGLTNYDAVLNYQAKRMLHLALDANWGGIFMIGTYRMPAKLVSSSTWVQTFTDYLNAFTQGNGGGISTSWTDQAHSQKPCDYSAVDDHWHAGPLAELGFFYPYTVDALNGRVAYDTARVSLYGAAGCMPDMFNNPARFVNPSPKWDIVPRR